LCPTGWHVPTDGEWTVLTDFLGGSSVAGNEMKTTYGWYDGGNGTNSSGFLGLPGGTRYGGGLFANAGANGAWWSGSPNGSFAWLRTLDGGNPSVFRDANERILGFSVRCIAN